MYRPENWEKLKAGIYFKAHPLVREELTERLIEATADAMLEALKKQAIDPHEIRTYRFDKKNPLRISFGDNPHFGFVVFIPDEEQE